MEDDRKASISALRRGIELGMRHIDTAEMYGSGQVEELVGEALSGLRDEVYLASKVLPANASYEGVLAACGRTLRRLRTDHLDLYLLHWPSRHPLEGTLEAFVELQRRGDIGAFGVSNFDATQMKQAVGLAGPGRVACNQVYYQLKVRAIEHDLLDFCDQNGVALVGYSPFGRNDFPSAQPVLDPIARAHNATSRQVALAFLVRRPPLFTIPKASRLSHAEENAGAGDLVLSEADLAAIDKAFPIGRPHRSLPTL